MSKSVFPSLKRRGGCAINKMLRSLQSGADGVVARTEMFRRTDHPVRAFQRMLRSILLMARPPLLSQEGNNVFPILGILLIFLVAMSTMYAMQVEQKDVEKLLNDADCHSCHSIDHKVVGPSYLDISKKYAGQATAVDQLTRRIRQGGSGNWGDLRMPAHPDLNDAQLAETVRWILALKDVTPGGSQEAKAKEYTYTVNGKKVTLNFPIFVEGAEGNAQMVTKDVFRGYQLYNSYCYRCHGTDVTESELAPDLRRFVAATAPQEFLSVVMAGREDKGMPMWAGFFTEEEVKQIYQYVKGRSLDLTPVGRPRSEYDSSKN